MPEYVIYISGIVFGNYYLGFLPNSNNNNIGQIRDVCCPYTCISIHYSAVDCIDFYIDNISIQGAINKGY